MHSSNAQWNNLTMKINVSCNSSCREVKYVDLIDTIYNKPFLFFFLISFNFTYVYWYGTAYLMLRKMIAGNV